MENKSPLRSKKYQIEADEFGRKRSDLRAAGCRIDSPERSITHANGIDRFARTRKSAGFINLPAKRASFQNSARTRLIDPPCPANANRGQIAERGARREQTGQWP